MCECDMLSISGYFVFRYGLLWSSDAPGAVAPTPVRKCFLHMSKRHKAPHGLLA